jgi:hypothetical protein
MVPSHVSCRAKDISGRADGRRLHTFAMRGCFGRTFSLGAKHMSTRTKVSTVWPFKTSTVIPFSFCLEILHSDDFLKGICRRAINDSGRMLRRRRGINRPSDAVGILYCSREHVFNIRQVHYAHHCKSVLGLLCLLLATRALSGWLFSTMYNSPVLHVTQQCGSKGPPGRIKR